MLSEQETHRSAPVGFLFAPTLPPDDESSRHDRDYDEQDSPDNAKARLWMSHAERGAKFVPSKK